MRVKNCEKKRGWNGGHRGEEVERLDYPWQVLLDREKIINYKCASRARQSLPGAARFWFYRPPSLITRFWLDGGASETRVDPMQVLRA